MPWWAGMATNYFLSGVCGHQQQSVRRKEALEFHSLLPTSRLIVRLFPVSAFLANPEVG
jgi:hypothetical protein